MKKKKEISEKKRLKLQTQKILSTIDFNAKYLIWMLPEKARDHSAENTKECVATISLLPDGYTIVASSEGRMNHLFYAEYFNFLLNFSHEVNYL